MYNYHYYDDYYYCKSQGHCTKRHIYNKKIQFNTVEGQNTIGE